MDTTGHENMPEEREKLPFEPFRTMGGKKGYAQDVVEDYVFALRDAYAELESECKAADSEKEKLEKLLEKEQAAHVVSKTELEQQRTAISAAAGKYKKVETEISELKRSLKEKETALEKATIELDGIKYTNRELRGNNNMLTEEVKSLEEQVSERNEEIAELKKHQYEVVDAPGGDVPAMSLMSLSAGATAQYVSLLDRVQAAADSYAYDVQQKADEMLSVVEQQSAEKLANTKAECEEMISAAKTKAEELLREAEADATGVTQTAAIDADIIRKKADETLKVAQQRADDVRSNARKELADIRALITQASAEYLEISSSKAKDTDLFDD